MVDTIETFVAKLQADGVEAGEKAARQIKAQAQQQAEQILTEAKAQAGKIIQQAKTEAETALAKSQTELTLAARDIVLKLRSTISGCIRQIMVGPVEEQLLNAEFLAPLLHDLVVQYAKADSGQQAQININLTPEMLRKLADWVIAKLRSTAQANNAAIDIKGSLNRTGFEYTVSEGGTVEVTGQSLVNLISELVGPQIRELLDQALFAKK